MLHLPVLRGGRPYRSLSRRTLTDVASGDPVAEVSQANRGLIARDLAHDDGRRALDALSLPELLGICSAAGDLFLEAALPLGDEEQKPADYVAQVSATTGLPRSLARANMDKIALVLANMEAVLGGLTRGLDLDILDRGHGRQNGRPLSYVRECRRLGAVLPNNSPGVHALWLPAIPLRVPLILKPGGEEPWTPYRIAQAFMAAGCPPEAFGFYPTDYAGAAEVLLRCERSLLFGGDTTVGTWKGDPGVQLHGPGRSKIVLGPDAVGAWEGYLDLMVESVAANGGRSCVNASGIWLTGGSGEGAPRDQARALAGALARRLAAIRPRALDDPEAGLAAFSNPVVAEHVAGMLRSQLRQPGVEDVTAPARGGDLLVRAHGCTFLTPTVVHCEDPDHPLANTEFLFPFVSVVAVARQNLVQTMGPSLVVTALGEEEELIAELLAAPTVERLNLGPIPTNAISWDQPHEGNLFEHLYRQRAFQR